MTNSLQADKRQTAQNISSAVAIRLIRYPVLIVYALIVPRLLGPETYGNYALIVSILMLAPFLLSFGTDFIFGRFGPEYALKGVQVELDRLFSALLMLRFGVTALIGLLLFGSIKVLDPAREEVVIIALVYFTLIFEQINDLLYAHLYGLNRVGLYFARFLLQTLFRLFFVLLLYPYMGFRGAVLALLVASISVAMFGWTFTRKFSHLRLRRPDLSAFWEPLKFGVTIIVPVILLYLRQQSGPTLLKLFSVSSTEIGYYDLANQLFMVVYGLVETGFAAFIPIVSKYESMGNIELGIRWMLRFLRYCLPALCAFLVGFYVFGNDVIGLLLGEAYLPVYPIALLMIASSLLWILGQAGYVYSVATKNTLPYLFSMSLAVFIFFGITILFVRQLGAVALAVATIAGGFTYAASMLKAFNHLASRVLSIVRSIIIASFAWSPLIFVGSGSPLWVRISLFFSMTVIFFAILVWSGIFNFGEIRVLLVYFRQPGGGESITGSP
jgi:O-antigen/teichoic acid export membrane protein